ncbi:uncharacterized protein [Diadema setosum]|uniref:uncharacterized protein n=1 Tax=Diadema setosum TaxID=31175 RepID=UPI003B3BAAD7
MSLIPPQLLQQRDPQVQHLAQLRERVAHARYHYNLVLAALAALVTDEGRREELLRRTRRRRWWMRPWIVQKPIYGQCEQLVEELRIENPADFKSFLRVEPDLFFKLRRSSIAAWPGASYNHR